AKQPFCIRLQLLARLAFNAGQHTANQPTRLAHLDDGNDRAILIQGYVGPAQVARLGHQGTPSVKSATMVPFPCTSGGRLVGCRKLARRADPPGATVPFPVLEAPRRDMCPGGLAPADAP